MEIEIDESAGLARIAGTSYKPEQLLDVIEQLCKAIAKLSPGHRDINGEPEFATGSAHAVRAIDNPNGSDALFVLSFYIHPFGMLSFKLPFLQAAEVSESLSRYLRITIAKQLAVAVRDSARETGQTFQ